jgi:DNA polymerase-3 subunit beta
VFKRLIEKTAFAMAHQDVRYYLNGLLLEIRAGRVRAVATDGHRLALCDSDFEAETGSDIQVILPRKAVVELGRMLNDTDDEMEIEISNSHVRIHTGTTSFTSKLIDGRFPDYERVMPSGETQELSADKDSLRQALTRTSILSNEKYRGIRFRLDKGLLHLQAHNPEQDEAEEELEVDYEGNEISIGFNVGYLLDVLGVIDTDNVHMALVDSNSSTLVTPADSNECRYVIMPMRL